MCHGAGVRGGNEETSAGALAEALGFSVTFSMLLPWALTGVRALDDEGETPEPG